MEDIFEIDKKTVASQGVDIKEILLKYFNYWWLFLIAMVLSLSIAWVYLRYAVPMYKVGTTMMIRNDNNRSGGLGADAALSSAILMQSNNVNKQNEVHYLRSRTMVKRVVEKLNLTIQYYAVGKVKTSNIYGEVPFDFRFIKIADSNSVKKWKLVFNEDLTFTINQSKQIYKLNVPFEYNGDQIVIYKANFPINQEKEFIVEYKPIDIAAINFLAGLDVYLAKDNSNLIYLDYVSENSALATVFLNTLVAEYNKAAIEEKNETNLQVLNFLEDRLRVVENQLDSVELGIMNFKIKNQALNFQSQADLYLENLNTVEQSIRKQEVEIRVVEILEGFIKEEKNKFMLVPTTLGVSDPNLLILINSYNEAITRRKAELETGVNPNSSIMKNYDAGIDDLRAKILKSLQNVKEIYLGSLGVLKQQNKSFVDQIKSVPQKERESRNVARQQEIKQSLYLFLLQKREEASISLASTISNARILDSALDVKQKIKPKNLTIYSIAFILGLFIPLLIIVLLDLFNDKVTTKNDISKATNAPIIGEVGHSEDADVLIFVNNSRRVIAEQLRILRTNLSFQLSNSNNCATLLVTSSFSGEGKSFVAINLAAAYAVSGKKTALLEFDLRKPKVLQGLKLSSQKGLTSYLVGSISVDQIAMPVGKVQNLDVFPCGPVPPNPSELLLNERLPLLFEYLKENYEVIIIDSAPVGLVGDSFSLGLFADTTLYVVRQRYTYKKQLQMINDFYVKKRLPKMGLVVNDVIANGVNGYYGYGTNKYGYGYSYGYGYLEDEKKGSRSIFSRIRKIFKSR